MCSQGVMSSMKTNHNPGFCPIEGQLLGPCSQVRARNQFSSLSMCTTRTTPQDQMLIIRPAFTLSSYVLPREGPPIVPRLRIPSFFMAWTRKNIICYILTMLHSQSVRATCEQASISNFNTCIHPSPDPRIGLNIQRRPKSLWTLCHILVIQLTSWSLESLAPLRPLSTLVTLDARTPRESRWSWFPNGSLQTSPHNE